MPTAVLRWSNDDAAGGNVGPSPAGPKFAGFTGLVRRSRSVDVLHGVHLQSEIKRAMESLSPGRSRPQVTRWPLIQSPLVLPRSRTTTSSSTALKQQWCRETQLEPSRRSHSGSRPIISGLRPTTIEWPPSRATKRSFW